MTGPLVGLKVVEFAGLGPAPFAAMMLSDLGADVLRIDRKEAAHEPFDVLARGRSSLALDLKDAGDVALARRAAGRADVLIEGFRPGVMERLGLGPQALCAIHPGLVYGRMTGWGQDGPLAHVAGHDIGYIAITGALGAMGTADLPPFPPLNLVGDFGGGALYLVVGILAALHERARSGLGQVVDAAIVDGTAHLMAMAYGLHAAGEGKRGTNLLDGGAPFYRCYECADGKYLAVGSLEPRFYHELLARLGCADEVGLRSQVPDNWPQVAARLEAIFRQRGRDEWCALLEQGDCCVAPVLSRAEAPFHPHNLSRGIFETRSGYPEPAPAPRFSRTPGAIQGPPCRPGEGGCATLERWVEIERKTG